MPSAFNFSSPIWAPISTARGRPGSIFWRKALPGSSQGTAKIALETTAGQGTCLGDRFAELAQVIALLKENPRIVVCIDTCHLFAAGYDLRSREGYDAAFKELEDTIGLDRLAVVHCNDSKTPLGSRVDRHAHIG